MVRIVILRPDAPPATTEIVPALPELHRIVGGHVGGTRITPCLYVYFREDARLHDLATCAYLPHLDETIEGTAVVGAVDDRGEPRSLSDDEVELALALGRFQPDGTASAVPTIDARSGERACFASAPLS